jgi:TPR repeat protein
MTSLRLAPCALLLTIACALGGPAPTRQPAPAELKRSRQELEKAAAGGEAEAQYQLGLLARGEADSSGKGQAARTWFRKAARQGHPRAQLALGRGYLGTSLGEKNLPLALKWLTRAANQGLAEAWLELGHLHADGGPGVLQDIDRARGCYRKAQEKGRGAEFWYSLAGVYRWGKGGVGADWPRAFGCYLQAAKEGHGESQYVVGQFYQYGIGTDADLARAVYWYTQAARQKNHWAEAQLGWLYEHGLGVPKDRAQALDWYKKSESHGGTCWGHRVRLQDPETLKRSPAEPEPVPTTKDVEVTLEAERTQYDLDDLIVIAIRYRNVGTQPYSFTEDHTGGFHTPFSVTGAGGRGLPNPFGKPEGWFGFVNGLMSTHVIEPGKTVVLKKTLNQCVYFERPGTYRIEGGNYVCQGKDGGLRALNENPEEKQPAYFQPTVKPLTLTMRKGDPRKRQEAIDALVRAYREDKEYPAGLARPAEQYGGRTDIVQRLVFYREPKLLPFFLSVLEDGDVNGLAETGLRALPGRAAVLKALEERLDHPETYRTLDLVYPYLRLKGLVYEDFISGEPARLDNWKRQEEIVRKCKEKALQRLLGDTACRHAYLVPGLLGGGDDLFLIEYLIRSRPSLDVLRRCSWALQKVKLGREHVPFLETLLTVKHDWGVTDAAILQLVRLDRDRYLPELKAHPENFSPEVRKLLLGPAEE